jgi:hypothetical protein
LLWKPTSDVRWQQRTTLHLDSLDSDHPSLAARMFLIRVTSRQSLDQCDYFAALCRIFNFRKRP